MERFIVNVSDIHDQYIVETEWSRDSVNNLLIEETAFNLFIKPLKLRFSFSLMPSKDIVFKGSANGTVELTCDRCLNNFIWNMDFKFGYILSPGKDTVASLNKKVEEEGIEKSYYNGYHIDLREYIVEQIRLNLPDYAHCREDCRGLCHICGTNLNESRCVCSEKTFSKNSPFSKLEKLKNR